MRAVASFLMIVGALALCSSAEAKGEGVPTGMSADGRGCR